MRHLLLTILTISSLAGFAQNPKIKITPLSKDLYVFTTYNTYKGALTDANAMYLVTKKGIAVIDAPWDSTQFQPFLDSIETKHHQKVVLAIATHAHGDRAGGLAFFKSKGIKTFTTKLTDHILKETNQPRADFTFKDDTTFTINGNKINTFYAGKGHTNDNIVIWFEKQKVLFGGCLVKSTQANDLGFIGEADTVEWPKTIQRVKLKYPNAKTAVTGHQAWGGKESLDYTLKLLNQKR